MNFVQPIREVDLLHEIEDFFKSKNSRDYIFFLLGIYLGLRVSDILRLRVKDLKDKSHVDIREKKTKKRKRILIHTFLKRELKDYLIDKDLEEYVIKSRKGENKPITRHRAYQILKEVALKFNIDSLGTHSLRKTFGYHFYKQTKDVALLQDLFNHAAPNITLRYIGINQDTLDKSISKFRY